MIKSIGGAGGSGSSSSRTPIEAPDSLKSTAFARIIDLVSEGEIVGLVDGLKSVYLDETPIANADNSLNFANVQVETRNGTQSQTYLKGFPNVESAISVGVELVSATPWVQAITNLSLSAVRVMLSVPALSSTNTTNGDVKGHTVEHAFDIATDGGPYVEVLKAAFTGKTSTGYERGYRLDLPDATVGWSIRVRRTTPNANVAAIQDRTFIQNYTEIIDGKFRYPNSALVAVAVDAEQFQSVPRRAYRMKGRIIRVPSNYNAATRVYTGIWDGTFQRAYTNNPAWIYFDMATHFRYGLGHLIQDSQIDKWELYKIGQYCDGMVSDGKGGMEPRFTCNIYLQKDADAYKVMQDLATVFRGISYWGSGQIRVVADKPDDPVYLYNNANVIEGKFTYQGSARKTRSTVAQVSWNDLNDFGRAKIEYIPDEEGIAALGIQETSLIAVGCTSQGQAWRVGQWLLVTSRYETQSVSFSVGIDGTIAAPGQIVQIADEHRAGRRIGGRIAAATLTTVTIDRAFEPGELAETITCILPNGKSQQRTIASIAGKVVTVTEAFTELPVPQSAWMTQTSTLNAQRFRVIAVAENSDLTFQLSCIQHNESKFDFIENGTPISVPSITELPNNVQLPPTGIVISHRFVAAISGVDTIVTADWPPVDGAVGYEVGYRMNNGPWLNLVNISDSIVDIVGVRAGIIDIRVNAVNSQGKRSVPVVAPSYLVPEAPSSLDLPPVNLVDAGGGNVIVDCTFDYFRLALNFNVTNFTFINVSRVKTIIIEVQQAGAFTVAFPPSVVPVSNQPYVATPVAGALDVLGLSTTNTGLRWDLVVQQPVDAGGGVMAVSVAPTAGSNTVATDGITPTAPSVGLVGTIVGGTAPFTHAWSRADAGGTNFLSSAPTAASTTISVPSATTAFPTATQTWRYTVTDSLGATASATATVTLTRTAPAGSVLDNFDGETVSKFSFVFRPASASATVAFNIRRNGTWNTTKALPTVTVASNDWISGPAVDSGDDYNVRFTPAYVSGVVGGITNGAVAMTSLGSDRTISLLRTKSGAGLAGYEESTYDVLVEIEEASNPGVILGSGTVRLIAEVETTD